MTFEILEFSISYSGTKNVNEFVQSSHHNLQSICFWLHESTAATSEGGQK